MLGHPLRSFVLPDDRRRFLEHLRQCRAGNDLVESEMRLLPRDGGAFAGRLFSKRSTHADRLVFPTIVIDLTEILVLERARQAAELQRDRAERDREIARASDAAKDRLIAIVSHELRNPLSPALMAADALSVSPGLPEPVRRLAYLIKRNIELEAKLIDDLLDVARVTRGRLDLRLQSIDVHRVLSDAVVACRLAAEAKQLTIACELGAAAHDVKGDESRLRQVFANLLNNAIKFTDTGAIVVRTANRTQQSVHIAVVDQGLGMDAETVDRVFAPFGKNEPSGQRGGLGLGLSITKGIVEAHGGRIWASSRGPGQGSTIEVELLVCEPAFTHAPATSFAGTPLRVVRTGHPEQPGLRVLVVEDHQDTAVLLKMVLTERGCDVTIVNTLHDARRELEANWDVVISDIGLEDGNGLDVAEHARSLGHRPQKLIALTGFGAMHDIAASQLAGFDLHLVKPVDLERLIEALPSRARQD